MTMDFSHVIILVRIIVPCLFLDLEDLSQHRGKYLTLLKMHHSLFYQFDF